MNIAPFVCNIAFNLCKNNIDYDQKKHYNVLCITKRLYRSILRTLNLKCGRLGAPWSTLAYPNAPCKQVSIGFMTWRRLKMKRYFVWVLFLFIDEPVLLLVNDWRECIYLSNKNIAEQSAPFDVYLFHLKFVLHSLILHFNVRISFFIVFVRWVRSFGA